VPVAWFSSTRRSRRELCRAFAPVGRSPAPRTRVSEPRWKHRVSFTRPLDRFRWLWGPAITEIEEPDLRSCPRLTGRAHTVRSTRIPARSHRVNLSEHPVGIDVGITWEYGNRTGFLHDLQESSERMSATFRQRGQRSPAASLC